MPRFRMAREFIQFQDNVENTDKITITTVQDPANGQNPEILVINKGDFNSNNFDESNVMASFNPTGRTTKIQNSLVYEGTANEQTNNITFAISGDGQPFIKTNYPALGFGIGSGDKQIVFDATGDVADIVLGGVSVVDVLGSVPSYTDTDLNDLSGRVETLENNGGGGGGSSFNNIDESGGVVLIGPNYATELPKPIQAGGAPLDSLSLFVDGATYISGGAVGITNSIWVQGEGSTFAEAVTFNTNNDDGGGGATDPAASALTAIGTINTARIIVEDQVTGDLQVESNLGAVDITAGGVFNTDNSNAGDFTYVLGRGSDSNMRLLVRQNRDDSNGVGCNVASIIHEYDNGAGCNEPNSAIHFHRGGSTAGGFISFTTSNDTERMRITSNGNIGIGTTNPDTFWTLDVSGSTRVNGILRLQRDSNSVIYFSNDSEFAYILFDSNFYFMNPSNDLILGTSNRFEDFILKADTGNVGIGTSNPAYRLDVLGSVNISGGLQNYGELIRPPSIARIYESLGPTTTPGDLGLNSTWNTRTLNTIDIIGDAFVSLESNQMTIQPGTYQIDATCPAFRLNRHSTRLMDVSNNEVILYGSSEFSSTGGSAGTSSFIKGGFTITAPTKLEIQHYHTHDYTQPYSVEAGVESSNGAATIVTQCIIQRVLGTAIQLQPQWKISGSNAYYDDGNVGLGTSNTPEQLSLDGGKIFFQSNANFIAAPTASSNGGNGTRIVFWPGTASVTPYAMGISNSTLWYSSPGIHRWYAGASATAAMDITSNGNVSVLTNLGVGVTNPARQFHVQGRNAIWRLDRDADTVALQIHKFPTLSNNYTTPWKGFLVGVKASASNNGSFEIGDYGTNVTGGYTGSGGVRFFINNTGDIGIGTTSPAYKLDINGSCRATSFTPFTGAHKTKLSGTVQYSNSHYDYLLLESVGQQTPESTAMDYFVHSRFTDVSHSPKVMGALKIRIDESPVSRDDGQVHVLSVGEGSLWVCEEAGNIANGDYLTSSSIPGFAMRQDSTLLHNQTAAKSQVDCSFADIIETFTVSNPPPENITKIHWSEEQRPRTTTSIEYQTDIQTVTLSNQNVAIPIGTISAFVGYISGQIGTISEYMGDISQFIGTISDESGNIIEQYRDVSNFMEHSIIGDISHQEQQTIYEDQFFATLTQQVAVTLSREVTAQVQDEVTCPLLDQSGNFLRWETTRTLSYETVTISEEQEVPNLSGETTQDISQRPLYPLRQIQIAADHQTAQDDAELTAPVFSISHDFVARAPALVGATIKAALIGCTQHCG